MALLMDGIQKPCYLFARKFTPQTIHKLLHIFSNISSNHQTSKIKASLASVDEVGRSSKRRISNDQVCTSWRNISMDPTMWHTIDMRPFHHPRFRDHHLDSLCRRAIRHGSGNLMDISIEYFANDDLLYYIAQL
ncbi:hypothetical protein PIB30_022460 [Stylosanthes scabra]|uniref:F-box domain-containing protein n=1 Tax=Stylosanthes scabra TaxID=79078 RepID=A0ABU6S8Z3_9FABA|nr:hypothetical protein [Stylosanthes scabra]